MSLLDEIRAEIGAVFEDTSLFFSDAVLTRATGSGGWSETAGSVQAYDCKAMVEAYSDQLRAMADIPDADVKLMIVGTSISVDPLNGDAVTVGGRSWSVIHVDVDPARAMWSCQARPVQAAAGEAE